MGCCASSDKRDDDAEKRRRENDFSDIDAPREKSSGGGKRGAEVAAAGRAARYAAAGPESNDNVNASGPAGDAAEPLPPPISITEREATPATPSGGGGPAAAVAASTAAQPALQNIARAAVLPDDDVEAARREKEALRQTGDVKGPKMMEFELEFDDDVIAAADDEAVIETFNNDFEQDSPPRRRAGETGDAPSVFGGDAGSDGAVPPQAAASSGPNGIAATATTPAGNLQPLNLNALGGKRSESKPDAHPSASAPPADSTAAAAAAAASSAEDSDAPPTSEWFVANGFKTPSVVWWQTPAEVHVIIAPADASTTGWELTDHYKISYNTTTIHKEDYGVELRLFAAVEDVKFVVEDDALHVTAQKCKVRERWPQLLRGTRKAVFDLAWITKDLGREVDDEDEDE